MIAGAIYVQDFLTERQSTTLLDQIDKCSWLADLKRRVQHFGYRYDYRARSVGPDDYLGPLPAWTEHTAKRLVADGHFKAKPDQMIVNEYMPGQGIAPHIDCVPCFGDAIASVSIGSGCQMVLQNLQVGEKVDLYLEPNSLLVLSSEARYRWLHGIPPRKTDLVGGVRIARKRRLSLTFRTVQL